MLQYIYMSISTFVYRFKKPIKIVVLSVFFLVIVLLGLQILYNYKWQYQKLPQFSNTLTQLPEIKNNQASYNYCLLVQTTQNSITCLGIDYDTFNRPQSVIVLTQDPKFPNIQFELSQTTTISYDNIQITPQELAQIQIPSKGIPVKITLQIQYIKPENTLLNQIIHAYKVILPPHVQTIPYQITHINILPKQEPKDIFKDSKTAQIAYLQQKLQENQKLLEQALQQNIQSITCTVNTCTTTKSQIDLQKVYTQLQDIKPTHDNLVHIFDIYCEFYNQQAKPSQILDMDLPVYRIGPSGALLTNVHGFLSCDKTQPILTVNPDLLNELAKNVYYKTELSGATKKLLLHSTQYPIFYEHYTPDMPAYQHIYDTRTNLIFQVFTQKYLEYLKELEKSN